MMKITKIKKQEKEPLKSGKSQKVREIV